MSNEKEVQKPKTEKEELRKKLKEDVENFLLNGGKVKQLRVDESNQDKKF